MSPTRAVAAALAGSALLWPAAPPSLASVTHEPPERDPPADLLRGPEVPDEKNRTLVHRGMMREFIVVEGRPEIAAVRLLELDEDASERVSRIVTQRTVDIATLLVDRIDTVREITDALTDDDPEHARVLLREIWESFDEGLPRDPLLEPLTAQLAPEDLAATRRVLDEYWDAWIDWELRDRADLEGEPLADARRRAEDRLKFALFQQEVREAYEVSLRRYRDSMQAIYDAVDPTPEQRAAIRTLYIQHIKDTRLSATPDERRAAARRVYDLLDPDRQAKLFDYVLRVAVPG